MRKRQEIEDRASSGGDEGINLTPLIDVVFIVLITFILIAPMLELDQIDLAQAADHTTKEITFTDQKKGITIHVHRDNSIVVNGAKIAGERLHSTLLNAQVKSDDKTVKLFHDRDASFGTYQMVKNAVEGAGYEQMDVILQPSETKR